jgi:colicin import membrane protein
MPTRADQVLAVMLALLLHALALLAFWISRDWVRDDDQAAAGPVIAATLQFTAADVRAAQAAVAHAKAAKSPEPKPPPPQPREVPRPQEAVEPPQAKPQAPLERPDTVEQEAITRMAPTPSDQAEEQRRREMQRQVDLTEELERQREAENRERLREQYEAIRREREEATRMTKMEEQRLAQLADRQPASPKPAHTPAPTAAPAGGGGTDEGLLGRYKAAMHATANDNWNRGLAPELVRCNVRFQQIPGGDVINVEFMDCPYDAQARESVERALRKMPMPYSGFESVFMPKVILTFCYPEEACIP